MLLSQLRFSSSLLQLSMLADVRSLVAPLDLELYDRLVLHREREAHQAWHGGPGVLHPQGYCNQNAGHGHPAMVGPLSHITLHHVKL